METTNTTYELINIILAGGLLGAIGQGIRIAVGLKKLDEKRSSDNTEKEVFTLNRLLMSIFIGFVAGAIALLIKSPAGGKLNNEMVFAIIASGYAGADFIEGVFNTYFKKTASTTASTNTNLTGESTKELTTNVSGELPANS